MSAKSRTCGRDREKEQIMFDENIVNDPRARKQCGVPVWDVDRNGEIYRVVEVAEGMYGDGRPNFGVFGSNHYWLDDPRASQGGPGAKEIYSSVDEAVAAVLR
jgi:hypothetical protein